jgi:hypothetical protein
MNYNSATMVTVKEVREALKKHFVKSGKGVTRYQVKDISGGNSFGYEFSIVNTRYETKDYCDENGVVMVSLTDWYDFDTCLNSFSVWDNSTKNMIGQYGCIRVVFNRNDVESILGYRV